MVAFLNGPYGLLLLAGLCGVALCLLPIVYLRGRRSADIATRLNTATNVNDLQDAGRLEPGSRNSLLEAMGRHLSKEKPQGTSMLRMRMIRAGYLSESAPHFFTGVRILCVVAMPIIFNAVLPLLPFALEGRAYLVSLCVMTGLGFILPALYLDRKIAKREQQYRDGFPDMMDLLVACVEAGLSIDAAILRISDELRHRYPYLADQLHLMALEIRAGRARNAAWRNLADRLGLDEARSLATMLKQAEELGTSIGDTLRVFSIDMRDRRLLLAEEKALALPAKLVLPLILFVFPTLLGVLILPAVVRMMWVFEQTA